MPEIDTLLGLTFHMYFFDNQRHQLPHIHVKYASYELIIAIETAHCLQGYLPIKQRKLAEAHIKKHRKQLLVMWNKAVKGINPGKLGDLC